MLTAILLASGFSRRFTADKLMLDFHGKPMLEHVMSAINTYPFSDKLLIQREELYTSLADHYNFKSVRNQHADKGQSRSIRLGVANSPAGSAFMFFVGDQPFLSGPVIKTLADAHAKYPNNIIIPHVQNHPRNPVIFPASFAKALSALQGDTGGRKIIAAYPDQIHRVYFSDPLPFLDIDTAKDYHNLQGHADI